METEDTSEPMIRRTRMSIMSQKKKVVKQKRSSDDRKATPPKRRLSDDVDASRLALNEVTLIHPADRLAKDEAVLANKPNSAVNKGPDYVCHLCEGSLYSSTKLKMHYLVEHRVLHCKVCDLLFVSDTERSEHEARVHAGRVCEICQVKMEGEPADHYRDAHDAISCRYCYVLLQPVSHYDRHVEDKHCATPRFVHGSDLDVVIEKSDSSHEFYCRMCEKNRNRELFGHLTYHHKLNLYFLAETLGRIGDLKIGELEERGTGRCLVCSGSYSRQVGRPFHEVYCEGRLACPVCATVVDDVDGHVAAEHTDIACGLECDLTFPSLADLDGHYQEHHKVAACQLCEHPQPDLLDHMADYHGVTNEPAHYTNILTTGARCRLCDESLLPFINKLDELYAHFTCVHTMSPSRILQLIGHKPDLNPETVYDSATESDHQINFPDPDFDAKHVRCHFDPSDTTVTPDLVCDFCSTSYPSRSKLGCHLHDAHGFRVLDELTKCDRCTKSFSLEVHVKHYGDAKYLKDETYECHKCGFAVSVDDAREHVLEEHADCVDEFDVDDCGARCRFCERRFWRVEELESHEVEAHSKEETGSFFRCYNCSNYFCNMKSLIAHNLPVKTECEPFTPIILECTVCALSFPTFALIRAHFHDKHGDLFVWPCPLTGCMKTFANKKYARMHYKNMHTRRNGGGDPMVFECEKCVRSFASYKSLALHMKNSHSKGFKCVICGEKCETFDQRKHHYSTVHPGELIFECSECQRTFLSKSGLHTHSKLHDQFSSVCSFCGKEFSRRDSYKEHLLIHIGPKHQCTYCPKSFTQKSNLRRHIRLHTGEKPYSCPYCSKTFSDKGACNSHTSVHTRKEECFCEVCGKKFSKQQKLRYHMKRHTGEGLVRCDKCHRGFTSQYDLRKHLQTHNQQTQIICECGRGFSSEKYLRTHIKVVHDPNRPPIKKKSNFNCFQCLVCKNIYSLRTTVLKHLRNIHKLDKKQYAQNIRRLGQDEATGFTPTVLEEQVGPSGKIKMHATAVDEGERKARTRKCKPAKYYEGDSSDEDSM